MKSAEKIYLGDGVYAVFAGWDIILTTENGINTTNTIVMELPIFESLVKSVAALREQE